MMRKLDWQRWLVQHWPTIDLVFGLFFAGLAGFELGLIIQLIRRLW